MSQPKLYPAGHTSPKQNEIKYAMLPAVRSGLIGPVRLLNCSIAMILLLALAILLKNIPIMGAVYSTLVCTKIGEIGVRPY